MTVARIAPLVVSTLLLAGCATSRAPDYMGRYPAADAAEAAGGTVALATLPAAAGSIVALRRTPYANGVSQEIVLEGPRAMAGENRIMIDALAPASGLWGGAQGEELRVEAPSDTGVDAEMRKLFPGIVMRISADAERSVDGPFGYASGRAAGLTCLYAWQYLAPARPLSLYEGATGTGTYPVSARVRLCRNQPLSTLLGYVRQLRVMRGDAPAAAAGGIAGLGAGRGDALDAALGPLPIAAPGPVMATRRDDEPDVRHVREQRALRQARLRVPAARHRRLLRSGWRRRVAWHAPVGAGRVLASAPPVLPAASATRVPMPGDVEVAAPRAAAASAARVEDALPLPH